MSQANRKGKQPVGAPALYKSPAQLEHRIEEYFKTGVAKRKVIVGPPNHREVVLVEVPTMSGLVLFLGFCSRQSFYDYEKRKPFAYTIKKARERICQVYEEQLHTGIPTGGIFALKNLGGWRDRDYDDGSRSVGPAPKFIFNLGVGKTFEVDTATAMASAARIPSISLQTPPESTNGDAK